MPSLGVDGALVVVVVVVVAAGVSFAAGPNDAQE
jgi:phosphate/sulfate permease